MKKQKVIKGIWIVLSFIVALAMVFATLAPIF